MTPQSLDAIRKIIVHTSATVEGRAVTVDEIDSWHKAKGWAMIGYHRVIALDGAVDQGRPFTRRGAHVRGNNINTIGICMIGGLDIDRKPKNTYLPVQFKSLLSEIINIKELCPNIEEVSGHRDYSPDLNGDGIITPDEWMKECPCFDVAKWLHSLRYEV